MSFYKNIIVETDPNHIGYRYQQDLSVLYTYIYIMISTKRRPFILEGLITCGSNYIDLKMKTY